ncbi:MAG: hypothetical protein BroJett025_04540 [Patescibacteria group bacterium]|nr:MAG: hypothetical protein BroJett025_04540 [Patescibacteria group bacterium]
MNYLTEFKIQQLRTKNMTAAVESIAVVIGAVVANMLVPQLLLKYVYTDTSALLEAPAIFTYFPLVTYSLALAYFLYAMVSNFVRCRKADNLEKEFVLTGGCCGDCGDGCCSDGDHTHGDDEEISEAELKELEKIVDEALKPKKAEKAASKKAPAKKKTAKK